MSSGDKMAPFLASEMAWVCHVIFFNYVYIYTNYSMWFYAVQSNQMQANALWDPRLFISLQTIV